MATLEQRGSWFRVSFRFNGKRYAQTLNTQNPRTANSLKGGIEKTIAEGARRRRSVDVHHGRRRTAAGHGAHALGESPGEAEGPGRPNVETTRRPLHADTGPFCRREFARHGEDAFEARHAILRRRFRSERHRTRPASGIHRASGSPERHPQATAERLVTRNEATDHFERTLEGSKWAVVRGWHVFRHSFASNCAACGIDQRLIDE
jgi:hypothetical protein